MMSIDIREHGGIFGGGWAGYNSVILPRYNPQQFVLPFTHASSGNSSLRWAGQTKKYIWWLFHSYDSNSNYTGYHLFRMGKKDPNKDIKHYLIPVSASGTFWAIYDKDLLAAIMPDTASNVLTIIDSNFNRYTCANLTNSYSSILDGCLDGNTLYLVKRGVATSLLVLGSFDITDLSNITRNYEAQLSGNFQGSNSYGSFRLSEGIYRFISTSSSFYQNLDMSLTSGSVIRNYPNPTSFSYTGRMASTDTAGLFIAATSSQVETRDFNSGATLVSSLTLASIQNYVRSYYPDLGINPSTQLVKSIERLDDNVFMCSIPCNVNTTIGSLYAPDAYVYVLFDKSYNFLGCIIASMGNPLYNDSRVTDKSNLVYYNQVMEGLVYVFKP